MSNQILQSTETAAQKAVSSSSVPAATTLDAEGNNALALVIMALLGLLDTQQQGATLQAAEIKNYANLQNYYNDQIGKIKFSVLPAGAKTATINRVQMDNEHYTIERANIQDELLTARQTGSVVITQASATMDIIQQDSSENSDVMHVITSMANEIYQMIQR